MHHQHVLARRAFSDSNRSTPVYRDNFHDAVRGEFEGYKVALLDDRAKALRQNFLLRMDAICGLPIARQTSVLYFAYGSNLEREQMRARTPTAQFADVACLDGFRLVFNKRGADGSAKANIVKSSDPAAVVHGFLYEIPEPEFESLEGFETGYRVVPIEVDQNGAELRARTFVSDANALVTGTPSEAYLSRIVRGAEQVGLPPEYINSLRQRAAIDQPVRKPHERTSRPIPDLVLKPYCRSALTSPCLPFQ